MTAATAAYDALLAHTRETALLGSTSALLAWDQETYMPRGAGEVRAQQLALLAKLQHERTTDPRVAEWLHTCENDPQLAADGDRAANVRGLRRDYDRATRLPATLVTALAELESRAQQEWADARSKSNFRRFQPWLERMVALQQQKADCLTRPGQSRWDALADLYEPGMNAASLRELFAPLRQRLVALRQKLARGKAPAETFGRAVVDEARQQAFGRAVLTAMGFDLQRGRIDQSAHPFCTSTGGDVRLTTRYHRDRVLDALGSTMHEGGHGLYEQGLDPRHLGTPLGEAVSLGIHESQSRLWENHVGRSAAFWHWCWPLAQQHLGAACDGHTAESVYRESNVVRPSLIRVEADEATYDLHVMIRFDIEQQLIDGQLGTSNLPDVWNTLYRDCLGVQVPDDKHGCLQDVHWSCGLFGYFPTYTLGNVYAGCLYKAMRAALPDLDADLARGDVSAATGWLREKLQRHGGLNPPRETVRLAAGFEPDEGPLLDYLEAKFGALYGL